MNWKRVRDCRGKPTGTLLGVPRTCNEKPDPCGNAKYERKLTTLKTLAGAQINHKWIVKSSLKLNLPFNI